MRRRIAAVLLLMCMFSASIFPAFGMVLCYGMTENTKDMYSYAPKLWNEGEQQQAASGTGVSIEAPSAVLMEASTGTVIFEKASTEQLRPASITKIMTLILIFDALAEGKIKLEDAVTTSEHAASMGGSQVFLEPGETQTVDTMLKCISVASANDACASYRMGNHTCTLPDASMPQKLWGFKFIVDRQ